MIVIKLIRYILGYVSFTAEGGFPERFVNLCTKNRIPLWNMQNRQKCITADTTVAGYKNIRQCAKKSGVRVRIEKKHGLPFFLSANKVRKGIIIGITAAVVIVAFLSTMVWSITVDGNKSISDEQILSVFSQLGVKVGVRRSSVSASDAADEAVKMIDGLNWASVNIRGSRVEIVVSEKTEAPEYPDTVTPCNIIAAEDGTILSIEVNIGEQEVKPGDAVLKGELLISGVTKNLDKSETLKAARGNVYARTNERIIASMQDESFKCESEQKTRYILYFFGLKIPLGISVSNENYSKTEKYLSNGKIDLPVGIICEHSFQTESETKLPPEYEKLYCAKKYSDEYKNLFENSEILKSSFFGSKADTGYLFKGEYECKKEIGVRNEIFVEKN